MHMDSHNTERKRLNRKMLRDRVPASDPTLFRWINAGTFPRPHYIMGRRYWYSDEVETWLQKEMSRPRATPPNLTAPTP